MLALQGDFAEHSEMLRKLDANTNEVRLPAHLAGLNGLIIPGGESTAMARLMDLYGLRCPLRKRARTGMAIWGTCAGLILMAKALDEDCPTPLGLMDIRIQRNAYGSQADSFEVNLAVPMFDEPSFQGVFIRAPKITAVGNHVSVLATTPDGGVAAVRENRLLATAFHPELTEDTRFHEYFLSMASSP